MVLAGLSVDKALPSLDPFERYGLSIPISDSERHELDRAAETLLVGRSVRSYPPKTRWQLLWRIQAAQHILRWYAKNPRRKTDRLAGFLDTLDDRTLMRILLLDSAAFLFAVLGAAHAHLLDDICCMPGLARLDRQGGTQQAPGTRR